MIPISQPDIPVDDNDFRAKRKFRKNRQQRREFPAIEPAGLVGSRLFHPFGDCEIGMRIGPIAKQDARCNGVGIGVMDVRASDHTLQRNTRRMPFQRRSCLGGLRSCAIAQLRNTRRKIRRRLRDSGKWGASWGYALPLIFSKVNRRPFSGIINYPCAIAQGRNRRIFVPQLNRRYRWYRLLQRLAIALSPGFQLGVLCARCASLLPGQPDPGDLRMNAADPLRCACFLFTSAPLILPRSRTARGVSPATASTMTIRKAGPLPFHPFTDDLTESMTITFSSR